MFTKSQVLPAFAWLGLWAGWGCAHQTQAPAHSSRTLTPPSQTHVRVPSLLVPESTHELAAPGPSPLPIEVAEARVPVLAIPDERLLDHCDGARAIVVHKAARQLELTCAGAVAARYATSLGNVPDGAKEHEGDGKTPEGEYYVTLRFPSQYHLSLQISYPGIDDAERGLREGLVGRGEHDTIVTAIRQCRNPPQNTRLGSLVQIHGGGGGAWAGDWTLGCVAVDNKAIERVFDFHRPGCEVDGTPRTKVVILP